MTKIIKRSVLITGVAGFIGSNLAADLLKRGYGVTGVDNLSQGSRRNINSVLKNKSFKFIKGDVRDKLSVVKAAKGVDIIVHLAAYKIPRYGNTMDTLMINSVGTMNALEAARTNRAKFIITSTSDVYGKLSKVPFSEDDDIVLGHSKVKRWSYAASKLFDEYLCFAYEEKHGLKVSVLRIFGSYGPNQNLTWRGGPQSGFINAAFAKKPIEVHGDGLQTRSFAYVDDTVDGIVRAIESKRSVGELINIGNNREISILDLAKLIWKMVNGSSKPKLKFIPYATFSGKNYQDVMRRVPDISKANRLLGFSPKTGLEEGLFKTIEWQRKFV